MSWFEKLLPARIRTDNNKNRRTVPEGLWQKCPVCHSVLYRAELERSLNVCPKCTHHFRMGARDRLKFMLDEEAQIEHNAHLQPVDMLKFKDSKKYKDRISQAQKKTKENDALVSIEGLIHGMPVITCAFEFAYMGGSMGSVVGEKFTRAANIALEKNIPMISFAASGGARMQEALFSLMQMAKTSAVLARLRNKGVPFISVLTDPTMGGVSASFAMLGDVHIAEPNALIGFAGPRVIEQTVRETLPDGFQRSEFLQEHGAIDFIVDRRELRDRIANLISILTHQPTLN